METSGPGHLVEFSRLKIRNELPHHRRMKAPQQAELQRRGIDEMVRPLRAWERTKLYQINNLILAFPKNKFFKPGEAGDRAWAVAL